MGGNLEDLPFINLFHYWLKKGFQVVAWDGPAHGDSPGSATHLPNFAHSLVTDINQEVISKPVALVGHSFGGASMAVVNKIYDMPQKVVIISAPTRVTNIFTNFTQLIKLSTKAKAKFIQLSEQESGYPLEDVSLVNNDISKTCDSLVIHDIADDVIPYSDFEVLKQTWSGGEFLKTEKLGHRMTIKDASILKLIVEFIVK